MTEMNIAVISLMVIQFSALWYRIGKLEGHLKRLNGKLEEKK